MNPTRIQREYLNVLIDHPNYGTIDLARATGRTKSSASAMLKTLRRLRLIQPANCSCCGAIVWRVEVDVRG